MYSGLQPDISDNGVFEYRFIWTPDSLTLFIYTRLSLILHYQDNVLFGYLIIRTLDNTYFIVSRCLIIRILDDSDAGFSEYGLLGA